MPLETLTAAIFDVDGVLVASPHERAWREALEEIVADQWGFGSAGTFAPERFTSAVYQEHVAGKTRLSGARAVLDYFGVPDADRRASEYAQEKQRRLDLLLEQGAFVAFPDGLRFVLALRARGFRLAAASSSKNANRFMERIRVDLFAREEGLAEADVRPGATLLDLFAANVCGRQLTQGKPNPEIFLLAAHELGVPPARCVVAEDAPAGIRAAKAGGMAAIGVARLGDEALLEAAGADMVVTTLDAVALDPLAAGRIERAPVGAPEPDPFGERIAAAMDAPSDDRWALHQKVYSPLSETGIESRFSVSNGFLGLRGSRAISRGPMWMSFLHTLSWASWPRTFVAGLFDTPNTEPPVPALAPAPDWLRIRVMLEGKPLLLRSGELLRHWRTLDMRRGLLLTEWHQRDPNGRIMRLRSLRMVSLADRPIGMQLVQLRIDPVPVEVTFETTLEVANSGLELARADAEIAVWCTSSSAKVLAMASAAELRLAGRPIAPAIDTPLQREWSFTSAPAQVATFCRIVSLARGDEHTDEVRKAACEPLARAQRAGWQGVLGAHAHAWAERWECSDFTIDGDPESERSLRFAVYHLNSAANPDDERVSIGARALTGDAYLGHVFWDTEIYLLPFYVLTWPRAARALLMYRYHTLAGARAKAVRLGYRGALYPWESADSGEETTPERIIDSEGRILEVLSGTLEHHISADVAYAVWHYWQATGDDEFLVQAGAEILLETARFWASRARREDDRAYHIRNVIGPDEYHERIDDNAFTNVMAGWNIARALEAADFLRDRHPDRWRALAMALRLSEAELEGWRAVAAGLVTGLDSRTGVVEQFAGYFGLEDIDLAQYAGRTVPMDVVLGRERTQRSQVVKQADVVALLALLPDAVAERVRQASFRYYEPRCGHGSSLSRSMHAIVAARLGDIAMAERYFHETAATDLSDTRGGSAGGVRIAALGGLWQAAIFGFVGLALRPDGLALDPNLPASWRGVTFRVQWRGRKVRLHLDGERRVVRASLEGGEPMALHVSGHRHPLEPGRALDVEWGAG
jgi:trehalose/maltose hydrolase-like predicted phosphorylase/beta-phosphoglucomutase-like phosphatase (HAD superfamily)